MEGGGNSGTPQSGECSKGSSNNVVGSESDLSGCGCGSGVTNSDSSITVRVTPTTGGQFDLQVAKMETVENLKKIISKKLKVPKERICLLHRDRQLRDGTLHENQLMDGSRLTLLPSVETGLLAQRPEQSVMQALESLNDSQVNDFLSGKAPLNLTMRLGDHMMLIQLQLSTVTPSTASSSSSSSSATLASSSRRSSSSAASSSSTSSSRLISSSSYSSSSHHHSRSGSSTRTTPHPPPHPPPNLNFTRPTSSSSSSTNSFSSSTPASSHLHHPVSPTPSAATTLSAAPLLGGTCAGRGLTSAHHPSASSNVTSSTAVSSTTTATSSATPSCRCDASPSAPTHSVTCPLSSSPSSSAATAAATPPAGTPATAAAAASAASATAAPKPTLDTRALAEASRNLTQTLKQLSSEVLTSRSDVTEESTSSANRRRQGAIIESMHHHGKGVYSGTFSGTLNPALQDKFGRPKRDISTIIHILNDLLCATPQYRRHARQGHTITIETPGPSPSAQSHSSGNTTSSASGSSSRPEMMDDEEESVELSRENQATRGKMEQLRLIMEERRARRRARREARATPYSHGSAALSGSSTSSSQWGGTVAGANYAQSAEVGENSAAINSNVPSAMDADSSTIPVSAGTATIPVSNCSSISMGNSASVNVPGMVPLPEPPTGGAVAELQVAGRDSTPPGTGVSASGNGGGAVSDGGSTTNASGGANGSGTNSASGSGDSPMETDSSAEICELNAEPVVA